MTAIRTHRIVRRHRLARRGKSRALRWVLIAALSLGALGVLVIAAGLGTAFAIYQSYAGDYVPIEEKLRQTNVGLTEIYDRGGP